MRATGRISSGLASGPGTLGAGDRLIGNLPRDSVRDRASRLGDGADAIAATDGGPTSRRRLRAEGIQRSRDATASRSSPHRAQHQHSPRQACEEARIFSYASSPVPRDPPPQKSYPRRAVIRRDRNHLPCALRFTKSPRSKARTWRRSGSFGQRRSGAAKRCSGMAIASRGSVAGALKMDLSVFMVDSLSEQLLAEGRLHDAPRVIPDIGLALKRLVAWSIRIDCRWLIRMARRLPRIHWSRQPSYAQRH